MSELLSQEKARDILRYLQPAGVGVLVGTVTYVAADKFWGPAQDYSAQQELDFRINSIDREKDILTQAQDSLESSSGSLQEIGSVISVHDQQIAELQSRKVDYGNETINGIESTFPSLLLGAVAASISVRRARIRRSKP